MCWDLGHEARAKIVGVVTNADDTREKIVTVSLRLLSIVADLVPLLINEKLDTKEWKK